MKVVSHIQSATDLVSNIDEAIFTVQGLSRFASMDMKNAKSWALECQKKGIRALLEWDILMTEDVFQAVSSDFSPDGFDAVRVQDPGAMKFLREKFPQTKIHLILENGNHNLSGLLRWCELGGKNLERLVLSVQIPKESLKEYLGKLPVPCEILVHGKLLLFYSRRSLIPEHLGKKELFVDCEESPHRQFPLIQNEHGTFLFYNRIFSLKKYWHELEGMGLQYARIENVDDLNLPLTEGFFASNKTDALFSKLTNVLTKRNDVNYLGDVLEAKKGEYIAIMLRNPKIPLRLGDEVSIIAPEARESSLTIKTLRASDLSEKEELSSGSVALINHVSGVSVRSAVYLSHTKRTEP